MERLIACGSGLSLGLRAFKSECRRVQDVEQGVDGDARRMTSNVHLRVRRTSPSGCISVHSRGNIGSGAYLRRLSRGGLST